MNTGQKIKQMRERAASPYVGPATREALSEGLAVTDDLVEICTTLVHLLLMGSGDESHEYQMAKALLADRGFQVTITGSVLDFDALIAQALLLEENHD
jgi:hypothetical protein